VRDGLLGSHKVDPMIVFFLKKEGSRGCAGSSAPLWEGAIIDGGSWVSLAGGFSPTTRVGGSPLTLALRSTFHE
jgi:hypothetical protein